MEKLALRRMRHNKTALGLALRPALVGRMGVAGMGKLEGSKIHQQPDFTHETQRVLCLECGDIKLASDFAPAQLKRKRPKCRACTGGSGAKMHSRPTGGHASKVEDDRSIELHIWERAGLIKDLREQVPFELVPKQDGERPVIYIADFVYRSGPMHDIPDRLVVEDTKGHRTKEYVIKRKLMLLVHGIKISEICQTKRKRGRR